MRTVFIINPKAGKGKNIPELINNIKKIDNTEVYVTKAVDDGRNFVKSYCEKNGPARFIACGGDGTLNEVLNGAIECENAEIGVMPVGTGNDFVRNFAYNDNFKNPLMLVKGTTVKCDAIKYVSHNNGNLKTGYCDNMFNIGFDCDVADMTNNIKTKKIASGPFAYFVSIFIMLVKKKCSSLKIEIDGEEKYNGELLLTSLANGSYCGGGIKSNPLASYNDGYININIIKNLSRTRFISLLPSYMKGTFLDIKDIEKYVTSDKGKKITITPNRDKIRVSIDGEINTSEKLEFEIIHNAFNFVLPEYSKENIEV